ncbi:hypothetical protein HID58_023869, partial [Brassica napus]
MIVLSLVVGGLSFAWGLTDLIPRSHGDSGRLIFVVAAKIESAVSSIEPEASPVRTLCFLAAASVGSVQQRYCEDDLIITANVSALWPLASLLITRCLLAAASVGSGQL